MQLSSKNAVISIREGEFEEIKLKMSSGISGQHKKGGQSSGRFYRKREEEIDFFYRKILQNLKRFDVKKWNIIGDKTMIKRFEELR